MLVLTETALPAVDKRFAVDEEAPSGAGDFRGTFGVVAVELLVVVAGVAVVVDGVAPPASATSSECSTANVGGVTDSLRAGELALERLGDAGEFATESLRGEAGEFAKDFLWIAGELASDFLGLKGSSTSSMSSGAAVVGLATACCWFCLLSAPTLLE